jgi:hypothetical protein
MCTNMKNNDKKEYVHRLGLPAAAQQQANAVQQQPVQTPDEVAPADAFTPGIEPGILLHHMLSANASNRGQTPATGAPLPSDTVVSVNAGGEVYSCTIRKLMYSIKSDIKSYTVTGSLMDGGANGSLAGDDVAI